MRNKLFSGIFGHFFLRASVTQTISGLMLLAVVLPFFDYIATKMTAEQGSTFANSTLAANNDALYKKEYGEIVNYCMGIMKDTPNVLFIEFNNKNGESLRITPENWSLESRNSLTPTIEFNNQNNTKVYDNQSYFIRDESSIFNNIRYFEFIRPIFISNQDWGVLTIGFSKKAYFSNIEKFYWTVIFFTIGSCLLSFYLFFASSRRIRKEMSTFGIITQQLSSGHLSVKASESAIGEIGMLGKAINDMSSALEEKSARVFQLAQIVEQTNDVFILFDSSLHIIFVNDAITQLAGYSSEYFLGMALTDFSRILNLSSTDILDEIDWMTSSKQHSEARDVVIVQKDHSNIDIEMRLEAISNDQDNEHNFLMVLSNITTRKGLETELHQLAFYDKLTGLPNRRMFIDHLQNTIKSSKRHNKSFALFFMDLDDFKNINDSLGHEVGDELLIEVGVRLKEIFRSNDIVARLGGDEFTIIIEDINEPAYIDIGNLAEKLVMQLSNKPLIVNGRPLSISTSVGVAKYPENGADCDTLVKNADTAMYVAKKSGKNNFAFFSDAMYESLRQYIELENDLKLAILAKNQLSLHYQPIISLDTKSLIGAEALARWQHPTKGFIPPVQFILIAEKSDLIITLGDLLLNMAFKQAHLWSKEPFTPYLSVNISVRQFIKPNFILRLNTLLIAYDVDPSKILLEFTEGIMLESTTETITKFAQIKALGFKIAIDDFGTGYSSLSYIHQLPIDVIKIDQSFVIGMLDNPKTKAIVTAISNLSASLQIKTIAEGIELNVHENLLRKCHCDYGQGYLYDKALPIDEFEKKYMQKESVSHLANLVEES